MHTVTELIERYDLIEKQLLESQKKLNSVVNRLSKSFSFSLLSSFIKAIHKATNSSEGSSKIADTLWDDLVEKLNSKAKNKPIKFKMGGGSGFLSVRYVYPDISLDQLYSKDSKTSKPVEVSINANTSLAHLLKLSKSSFEEEFSDKLFSVISKIYAAHLNEQKSIVYKMRKKAQQKTMKKRGLGTVTPKRDTKLNDVKADAIRTAKLYKSNQGKAGKILKKYVKQKKSGLRVIYMKTLKASLKKLGVSAQEVKDWMGLYDPEIKG